jgi:dCMP deaminase
MLVGKKAETWDTRFIDLAEHVSRWSKDPSTKVGAVIADEIRVVSLGFNGLPVGMVDTYERLHDRELKYQLIVHAERNALLFSTESLKGCTIYTWPFMPCSVCAGMIIQSGISRVVAPVSSSERWADNFKLSFEMFLESGVRIDLI